jgi:succinyl-CoA synthetase beta subunit
MSLEDDIMLQVPVDINVGLTTNQARDLALKLGFHKQTDEVAEQMKRLYKMFIDVDAVQVEINPLGETEDGQGDENMAT